VFIVAFAVLLVFAVGLADDILNLRPWQKLLGQFFAALLAATSGVEVHVVLGSPIDSWLSVPVTVFWLVGCANAFNLIDGLDGLASGVGLFATATMFIAGLVDHNVGLMLVTAPLAGCLLGFIRYNYNPASVYLGDCGSLAMGFLLGCCGALWEEKSATILGMTAPVMVFCVPLLDTSLSIVRRFLRNKPIFGADRGHIHHRLLDMGLSPRRAVWMLYGLCGIAAVLSLLHRIAAAEYSAVAVLVFCGIAWMMVRRLGYVEFDIAGKLVFRGTMFRMVDDEVRLQQLRDALLCSDSVSECVQAFSTTCRDLGFAGVRLSVAGTTHEEAYQTSAQAWQVRIPVVGGYVNLSGTRGAEGRPLPLDAIAQLVQNTLARKLHNQDAPAEITHRRHVVSSVRKAATSEEPSRRDPVGETA
jgi:UDP-GlcNAc:undecaprenyl-phosphate GlcNAc-1-phosphate transferase